MMSTFSDTYMSIPYVEALTSACEGCGKLRVLQSPLIRTLNEPTSICGALAPKAHHFGGKHTQLCRKLFVGVTFLDADRVHLSQLE